MTLSAQLLAQGTGWRVSDVVCTAGPQDRPYEEQHGSICMALVTEGSFQYHSLQGRAVMVPNSVLLGNLGAPFHCSHEHGSGDRCLSFQYSPEYWEQVCAAAGVGNPRFSSPLIGAMAQLLPLIAAAQALRDRGCDGMGFEELALDLAGTVCRALNDRARSARAPSYRDEQRIAGILRRIEAQPDKQLSLHGLARDAAMSPYHFLRVFRQVVGLTPGQFMLRSRLRRAAVRLRTGEEKIAAVALDCGFGDLSTFNRHFRRTMGISPGAYRIRAGRANATIALHCT